MDWESGEAETAYALAGPFCEEHEVFTELKTSQSDKNPGRQYYGCPTYPCKKNGFRTWAEYWDPPPEHTQQVKEHAQRVKEHIQKVREREKEKRKAKKMKKKRHAPMLNNTDYEFEQDCPTAIKEIANEYSQYIPDEVWGAKMEWERLKPDLVKMMYPYQRKGIIFGLNRGRFLLADEMGLGKTLQAIAVASYYREKTRWLIICPACLTKNWEVELKKWSSVDEKDIQIVRKGSDVLTGKVCIISYDLCSRMHSQVEEGDFGTIIADESHYLKNNTAKRTRRIVPMLQKAERSMLLYVSLHFIR